jgi:UDPglucose 6-dehydrogenase
VRAFDPEGREARDLLPGVIFAEGPYEAVDGADAMVLLTEWDQFRALDLDRIRGLLRAPVVIDLRNVYRPEEMRQRGFRYSSIGRP